MNSVFMENMTGVRDYNSNRRIKSNILDSVSPYKMASFSEALAFAMIESKRCWNTLMIEGAQHDLVSFKEGFTDDAKTKLNAIKDAIIKWVKKIWKAAVTLATKLYAYIRTRLTSGKELFKNKLEEIRKGQKLFETGDAKEISNITLYYYSDEYKGAIDKINTYVLALANIISGLKADSYENMYNKTNEEKSKITTKLKALGINKKGKDFVDEKTGGLLTFFGKVMNSLDDDIKLEKFGKDEAKVFDLQYIEKMINAKSLVDRQFKDTKKFLDKLTNDVNSEVKEFDKEDEDTDQFKIAKKKLSDLRELMAVQNSIFIAVSTNTKKFVSSAHKVIKIYASAGIVGKNSSK